MAKDEAIAKVAFGGFLLVIGAALLGGGSAFGRIKKLFPDPKAGPETWKTCLQNWQAVNANSGTLQQLRTLFDACPISSRSVFFEQADVFALLQKIPPQHHDFFKNIVREWSGSWMSVGKRVTWPYAQRMSRLIGETSEANKIMWFNTMSRASFRMKFWGILFGGCGAGLMTWGSYEMAKN